ncbi:MAG: sugar phosphate isomerase/epimerase [Planctomycetes bacterium]|nr:sugar phosphate isomerase/epimerase [Planctomycetota bacterium]
MTNQLNRRQAILAAVSAAVATRMARAATEPATRQPICVFTKPFNSLSFDALADRIAEIGFDGIEAPIRKGGHVEPTEVEDKLPKLVEALRKRDLEITVMASDVNDPNDPVAIRVLRTAADLGIRRYRMKYLRYDMSRSVVEQLDEWRPRFRDLAAMNHDLGIRAVYQNHASARNLGAALWDLKHVLEGIPVDQIGVAYDIRHATVEGGMSWPVTFNVIRPHIDTVYVKDFRWVGKQVENVPLGEGQINPKFFKMLADSGFAGPVSLHEEYLDHRNPELVPQHLAAIKRDFATLKAWQAR